MAMVERGAIDVEAVSASLATGLRVTTVRTARRDMAGLVAGVELCSRAKHPGRTRIAVRHREALFYIFSRWTDWLTLCTSACSMLCGFPSILCPTGCRFRCSMRISCVKFSPAEPIRDRCVTGSERMRSSVRFRCFHLDWPYSAAPRITILGAMRMAYTAKVD